MLLPVSHIKFIIILSIKKNRHLCREQIINMENTDKIIAAMKKSGKPVSAGQLVELTGMDRKEVDKAMKVLKAEGKISSPRNCFWEPAK